MTWEIRNTSGVIIDWDKYHVVTHDEGGVDPLTTVVFKSLFDAQTILQATSDDTPVALTVTPQTLVGRLTGGNISAITIGIANDNILQVDHTSPADDDYAKFTIAGIEGRSYQELVNDISGVIKATDVEVLELSTATYDDVQDYINFFGDRTLLSGGDITDNGDGTVAVASLTGWCAISNSETAVGKFFDYAGGNTSALTDLTTNYIYLDYNGGTPQLVVSTSILTHGFKLDHIHVGTAFRDGTETHFHKPTNFELALGATVDMHHQEEDLVHRVDGLITTETGTRNLSITAGVLYEGLNRHTSLPFVTSRSGTADFNEVNKLHDAGGDFSVNDVGKSVHNTTDDTYGTITAFVDSTELTLAGDTFPLGTESHNIDFWTYHYYDGDLGTPAWVEVHGATQISNSQYNDVATGLANFTSNRYGVSWVFMEIDGLHFHVVYGQGDYKVNEAEEAGVPSSLPNIVTNYCALIAKIILQQGQTTMTITYPWTTVFTSSLATDHGSLGGLGDVADHDYALLHNGTRALSGAWDMGSQNLTNVNIDSGTVDGVTITAPVLDGTVTNTGAALILPAFTLGGTMDADSQALINVLDLDLGTESTTGTFSATLTAANAGTAWLINSKDTSDILRPRLGLSGGVDTAVWAWVNSTHTGIVLSGAVACGDQAFTGVGDMTFTDGSQLQTGIADNDFLFIDGWDKDAAAYVHMMSFEGGRNDPVVRVLATGGMEISGGGAVFLRGANTNALIVRDDNYFAYGTSGDFTGHYETADADAKITKFICHTNIDSPNNVPVWFFGDETYQDSALGSTAGFDFAGLTQPRIVLGDNDGDSNVQLGFIGDDRSFIGCGGTGTLIELPDTQGFATGQAAGDYFILTGYDSTGATRAGMEAMRILNNTTTPCKIGFYGVAPVVKPLKANYNNWAAASDVAGALAALGLVDLA